MIRMIILLLPHFILVTKMSFPLFYTVILVGFSIILVVILRVLEG